ncbi:hypothetical protein [Marinobacter sp.]|uniref:hypothetical protein n=1 Tax=Marinobacter sp. TaxID=50741 RepID=UPI0035C72AD6
MLRHLVLSSITLVLAGAPAYSPASTVSDVSVNIESRTISITGSNFGLGPNQVLYDSFENPGALAGEPISLNASITGNWSWIHNYYTPTYASKGKSGNSSVVAVASTGMQQLQKKFDGTQEVFVSYSVLLDGEYFPGDKVYAPRTFSEDSSYKMLWLFDQDVGGDSSDVCLPTHVGSKGKFYIAGNDYNMVYDVGNEWWSWDNWMRITFWLKANPEDPTAPGKVMFETLSADKGYKRRNYNVPVFDADGVTPKAYRQMNFPGWVRSMSGGTRILYDDIYIALGSNSAARVEVGNAPTLNEVTKLEFLKIESWSPTEIIGTYPTVTDDEIKQMYLYLTGADGITNDSGIPLFKRPSRIENINVQ